METSLGRRVRVWPIATACAQDQVDWFRPAVIFNRGWTPKEYVATIKTELSCAFDQGYRVIAGPAWTNFGSEIDGWMTLLHARDHWLGVATGAERVSHLVGWRRKRRPSGAAQAPTLRSGASADPQEEYVEVIRP